MHKSMNDEFTSQIDCLTIGNSTPTYTTLINKNLVSIQDCLEANNSRKKWQQQQSSSNKAREALVFIDASWYHKGGRSGREEFEQGPRIEGAKYLDMNDIATTKELFPELNPKGLPQMLPTKELFAATMDALHITKNDHIIIYGKEGTVFTPRTWFLFKTMGHDPSKIHLMQGSLEQWIEAGGEVETESQINSILWAKDLDLNSSFSYPATNAKNVYTMSQVYDAIQSNKENTLLLDPRGSSFQYGYIPNAIHIPYSSLVNPANTLELKSVPELKHIFLDANVDIHTEKRIICTCGSGVSVCHLMLALEECGRDIKYDVEDIHSRTVMYDGSWAEWSSDPDTPKIIS